jgi:hypothetical protein
MLSDRYTQAVFTVIAVSLAVIVWKLPVIDVGHAQNSSMCTRNTPCYITTEFPLKIIVENARDFPR